MRHDLVMSGSGLIGRLRKNALVRDLPLGRPRNPQAVGLDSLACCPWWNHGDVVMAISRTLREAQGAVDIFPRRLRGSVEDRREPREHFCGSRPRWRVRKEPSVVVGGLLSGDPSPPVGLFSCYRLLHDPTQGLRLHAVTRARRIARGWAGLRAAAAAAAAEAAGAAEASARSADVDDRAKKIAIMEAYVVDMQRQVRAIIEFPDMCGGECFALRSQWG